MRRLPVLVSLACLALPAAAHAQGTPAPAQVDVAFGKSRPRAHPKVALGRPLRVRGIVCPFAPGQRVSVHFKSRGKVVKVVHPRLRGPSSAGCGHFSAQMTPRRPGAYFARADLEPTPGTAAARSALRRARVIAVLRPLHPGSRGPSVRLLQRQLRAAGYVVGRSGLYDDRTARAVLAFRKLSGLPRTTNASRRVLRRLAAGGGRFRVSHPDHGHHVEADLSHQILALIDHGKVQRIYPLSSGKPSTPTVLGSFRVYSKTPGYNAKGMYFSNYFIRGYAIHGYAEVPVYPASHGCLRVPIPDAISIYNWVRFGDRVDVYYRTPGHRSPKPSPNAGP
jgi:peptidoglycan hydrolase-like protein with peptidoglycan-binding domain